MTEESTKKRDELAEDFIKKNLNIVWWQPTLIMKVAHQAGFDAGYQMAMDEMSEKLNKLENLIANNQIIIGNEKVFFIKKEDDTEST